MKRHFHALTTLALLALMGVPVFAAKQTAPQPTENSPVAFKITIADLHQAALSGDDTAIPGNKLLLIDAEIGSITNRSDTEKEFIAEVELLGGAWNGEERVDLYRAYAVFNSPQFREYFSRKGASRLTPGDRIIILCRYLGLGLDYDEKTTIAIVEAIDIRHTQ